MKFGSVCSGIEAASVAWSGLPLEAAFLSEIDAFPRAVLQHHYPDVPLHGDFTIIGEDDYEPIELLVGGTPCQDFSIAGLRKGLSGERGNLTLQFLRLAQRLRPKWLVWENVPGILSIDDGRAFGAFLGGLAELGYGFAYRILDAQFFGVAQRRRRVFVVGYSGDWRPPAAVLFERESLRGDSPPSRQAGQEVAGTFTARAKSGGWGQDPNLAASGYMRVANAIHAADGSHAVRRDADNLIADTLTSNGDAHSGYRDEKGLIPVFPEPYTLAVRGRSDGHNLEYRQDGTANAILTPNGGRAGIGVGAIAFAQNTRDEVRMINGDGQLAGALAAETGMKQQTYVAQGITIHGTDKTATAASFTDLAGSLRARPPGGIENSSTTAVMSASAVRRLTPRECERLQGFPDDYTFIPYRGKMAADGPRYKALGNSMAVPVMRWIGQRIIETEEAA